MLIVKLLKYFLIAVILLFILIQIKFMPSYQSSLTYNGFSISITRDQYNIPSIKGSTKLSTFYALGYATAQDRLFQLHMKRMLGKGRLAELVGEKGVNLDIFFRQLGVWAMSRQSVARMKAEDRIAYEVYQAYADGVNDYAMRNGVGIEFWIMWCEFEKWQVEDTFVIFKLTDWVQSADGGLTVARELLAQEVGYEEAQKILGWREEDFIMVKESTMMSEEELRVSGQSIQNKMRNNQQEKIVKQVIVNKQQQKQIAIEENIQAHHEENLQVPGIVSNDIPQQNSNEQIQITEKIVEEQNNQDQNNIQKKEEQQEQEQQKYEQIEAVQNIEQREQQQQNVPQQQQQTQLQKGLDQGLNNVEQPTQINQVGQTQQQENIEQIQQEQHLQHQPQQQQQTEQIVNQNQVDQNIQVEQLVKNIQIQNTQELNEQLQEEKPTQTDQYQSEQNYNQPNPETQEQDSISDPQPIDIPTPIENPQPTQIKSQNIDPQFLHVIGGGASNSWVISGRHTKSGRPIIANDPHLATIIPSDWFQAQIQYPHEGRNITFKGAFIAGTAASASIGRANYITWGCTTEYKDTQDMYREKVEGNKYFVDGEWKNLNQRQERIRVKNGEDKIITISESHRGPLLRKIPFLEKLYDVPGNVSFSWTGIHTQYDFLSFMIGVIQSDNHQSVLQKFASLDYGPAMNVVFITQDGNIGYQSIGRVPLRKGLNYPFFYDGTSSANDWDGYITGRDKLYLDNPEKGFIVTANSRPASSNFHQGYYDTNFQVTARQHRITKLISQKIASGEKLSIQDSIDIQLDNTDEYCLHILPSLKLIDTRFFVLFDRWDCNFSSTAYQPSIYEAFFLKLQRKLYTHNTLNIHGFLKFNHYTYKFILSTAETRVHASITKVSDALTEALTMLQSKFNTQTKQNWHWGHLHLTYYPHLPFSNVFLLKSIFDRYHISAGSLNTPNMGKMTKLQQDNFNCQHHATLRIVLSYEPGESKWVIDTGVSSYPFSNHYDDQELLHKEGQYIDFDSKKDSIKEETSVQL